MRHWRYARRLLGAGLVMLGTGLPLAGPASASSLQPTDAAAPSPVQVAELTASDSARDNYFGSSVAITPDGNTALISADGNDNDPGAAYVFTRTFTGWRQTAELTASDAASGNFFGRSVALTPGGNIALIGAAGNNSGTGAAYVFTRTRMGWQQTAELTAGDAASNNEFGESVAIAAGGHTALIGAPFRSPGAAYLFTRTGTGWQQTAALTATDGATGNVFGGSVAITPGGHNALIGASGEDGGTGAAYLFTRTRGGWEQTAELTATDAAAADYFGASVAIAAVGHTSLIGSVGNDILAGAAYVFAQPLPWW